MLYFIKVMEYSLSRTDDYHFLTECQRDSKLDMTASSTVPARRFH